MKEIVYIQAGNRANYIGTHFWNTQESYFTYDDNLNPEASSQPENEPFIDHDISFRQGWSVKQSEPTFCPRLLVFDYKANFGGLGKYHGLYSDQLEDESSTISRTWRGASVEHKQISVSKSDYQRRLDAGEDDTNVDAAQPMTPRFWSDFNRMYYIPRSLQALSDLPDWEQTRGSWEYGRSAFERYDADVSVMDEDLRKFVEECDNLQGFQVTFDVDTFGGFTSAFLENCRDEFPKHPVLTIPILSGSDPAETVAAIENEALARTVVRDAVCLNALDEFATHVVPLQDPASAWKRGRWLKHLELDATSLYQTSAILSAHLESVTLPSRLKHGQEDLADLCMSLNWAQNNRFSHLTGDFPFVDDDDIELGSYDFSAVCDPPSVKSSNPPSVFARRLVTRGLSLFQARIVDNHLSSSIEERYFASTHAPAYPLPTSFPAFFNAPSAALLQAQATPRTSASHDAAPSRTLERLNPHRPTQSPLLSVLTTSRETASLFASHARLAAECVRRRRVPTGVGFSGLEGLRELEEAMLGLRDAYGTEDGGGSEADLGEDEEMEFE